MSPAQQQQQQSTNGGGGGIAARLARKNILELQPYRCARDDYSEGILLDANENALGPPLDDEDVLERYPDPYQVPLKRKYAAYRGCNLQPENIFVGVGSDEAIDLLMRIFCRPGVDKALTTPPTYGMYKVCAKVNDVGLVNVPLTPDFDVRIPEVRAMIMNFLKGGSGYSLCLQRRRASPVGQVLSLPPPFLNKYFIANTH